MNSKIILQVRKRNGDLLLNELSMLFFLARQNIAFRSHRDEGVSKLVNDNVFETNSGDFLEVIRLLADYDVFCLNIYRM